MELIFLDCSGSPIGMGAVGLTDRRKLVGLNVGNNHFTCLVKLPVLAKGNYFMVAQIAKPWVAVIDKMDAYLPFEGIASAWRREKDNWRKSRVTAVWNLARN